MKKTVRNILIGSGAFALTVAAVSALSYNITKKLVKVALDREEPKATKKSQEKLVGSETFFKNIEERNTYDFYNDSDFIFAVAAGCGFAVASGKYCCKHCNAKQKCKDFFHKLCLLKIGILVFLIEGSSFD